MRPRGGYSFALVAAVGIALSSPGPILYWHGVWLAIAAEWMPDGPGGYVPERRRAGYGGREFTFYKLRTMHVHTSSADPIRRGTILACFRSERCCARRRSTNCRSSSTSIRGDMALVGPRPEARKSSEAIIAPRIWRHFKFCLGLTSPGSLYYYTQCEALLPDIDIDPRLRRAAIASQAGIDRVYLTDATVQDDLRVVLRTIRVIAGQTFGRRRFSARPQMEKRS